MPRIQEDYHTNIFSFSSWKARDGVRRRDDWRARRDRNLTEYPAALRRAQKSTSSNQTGQKRSSKPPNCSPRRPAKHEERASRLIDEGRDHRVCSLSTVMPIDRILWPEPIYPKDFENERCRGREIAGHEAGLGRSVRIRSAGRRRPPISGSSKQSDKRVEAGFQVRVGIQQKNQRGGGRLARPDSRPRRNPALRRIGDERERLAREFAHGCRSDEALSTTTISTSGSSASESRHDRYNVRRLMGDNDDCDTGHVSMRRTSDEVSRKYQRQYGSRARDGGSRARTPREKRAGGEMARLRGETFAAHRVCRPARPKARRGAARQVPRETGLPRWARSRRGTAHDRSAGGSAAS